MPDREARIIVQGRKDGKQEVFCYDPKTGRTTQTGLAVAPSEVEATVKNIKQTLEQAGNHVTVKEP